MNSMYDGLPHSTNRVRLNYLVPTMRKLVMALSALRGKLYS